MSPVGTGLERALGAEALGARDPQERIKMISWNKASTCDSSNCVKVGVWKKSTQSGPWTDNCVEVSGTSWNKSSESATDITCVETNLGVDEILVRDSKDPDGPVLRFTGDEWTAFIAGVKLNEFDLD
jgi:hypothetical protein